MNKHVALFFLAVLLFCNTRTNAQLPSLVAKNEKAIFIIESYNEYGACTSSGTGFFVDKNGTGITALHVLEGAKFAYATTYQGEVFRIEKINAVCEDCDMASFQVVSTGKTFPFISTSIALPAKGSELFIIGNPEGYKNSVTTGILSGTKEEKGTKIIQTTAPISAGSSGSPLMNMKGQAIGVVSYSNDLGQNLNFAYSLTCLPKLKPTNKFQLTSPLDENIHFINRICPGEQNLTLHSIELSDSATIVNYAYSNASIAFGDGAFIYSAVNDSSQSMFIRDRISGKKYYCTNTTLGTSVKDPTVMKFGETVYFKLYFPSIGKTRVIDIGEDMKGGDWSFEHLIIPEKSDITYDNLEAFYESSYQSILSDLNGTYFKSAYRKIKELYADHSNSARFNLLGAVVTYALNDKEEAINYLKKVIELDGTSAGLYADLYEIYMELEKPDTALAYINLALEYNNEYIEFYHMRAEAHYAMENWAEGIRDYQTFIHSGRDVSADLYLKMGIAKFKINDSSACDDFQLAKDLAESDREWERINAVVKSKCRRD